MSPNGRFLYLAGNKPDSATGLNSNYIFSFAINTSRGSLSWVATTEVNSNVSQFIRRLRISPNGTKLVVHFNITAAGSHAVRTYGVNTSTSLLTPLNGGTPFQTASETSTWAQSGLFLGDGSSTYASLNMNAQTNGTSLDLFSCSGDPSYPNRWTCDIQSVAGIQFASGSARSFVVTTGYSYAMNCNDNWVCGYSQPSYTYTWQPGKLKSFSFISTSDQFTALGSAIPPYSSPTFLSADQGGKLVFVGAQGQDTLLFRVEENGSLTEIQAAGYTNPFNPSNTRIGSSCSVGIDIATF